MSFFSSLRQVPAKDFGPGGKPCQAEIVHISVNATGSRVVNTRTDRSIRIWRTLQLGLADPVVIEATHAKPVERISWNPNTDTSFASVGGDACVKLWKGNGTLEREIRVTKKGNVCCELVEFSPDGELLAVVDRDGTVVLYDVNENYAKVAEKKLAGVTDIKWTNRGHEFLIAATSNGNIGIFRLDSNLQLSLAHTLTGHRAKVTCLAVDPRGKYIAAGSDEGLVSFWKTADMICHKVLARVNQEICGLDMSRDGSYLAVAYDDGFVRFYDYESLEQVHEISNCGKVPLVRWFPNKGSFVSLGDRGKVMEVARKEPERPLRGN